MNSHTDHIVGTHIIATLFETLYATSLPDKNILLNEVRLALAEMTLRFSPQGRPGLTSNAQ